MGKITSFLTSLIRRAFHRRALISAVSRVILLVYIFTNVAFAHKPEVSLWEERNKLAMLPFASAGRGLPSVTVIPAQAGIHSFPVSQKMVYNVDSRLRGNDSFENLPASFFSHLNVRSTFKGNPQNPTIFLIEDVHQNAEAQNHISDAIKSFGDLPSFADATEGKSGKGKVLVGLEGAHGAFLYDLYKALPDHGIAQMVADSFLQTGNISGPAHAGFTSYRKERTRGLDFLGIDDPRFYRANVAAYRNSHAMHNAVVKRLEMDKKKIALEKENTFDADLKHFDSAVEAHRSGAMSLGEYVKIISNNAPLPFAVETFLEASQMEKSMDLVRVESERAIVFEKLVKTMSEKETEELMHLSLGYQQNVVTFAQYYGRLKDICHQHKLDLTQTPHFDDYIRYVLLTESVNAEKLDSEICLLEADIYGRLAKTDAQRNVVEQSRWLYLIGELIEFRLTSRQWQECRTSLQGSGSMVYGASLKPFEQFYRTADARSEEMVKNILAPLHGNEMSLLVAGGFHTSALTQRFRQKNISYVVAAPKLTKIDSGSASAYLSVFDREKSSLEQIFAGKKLFMAAPVSGQSARSTGPMVYLYTALVAAGGGLKALTPPLMRLIQQLGFSPRGMALSSDNVLLTGVEKAQLETVVSKPNESIKPNWLRHLVARREMPNGFHVDTYTVITPAKVVLVATTLVFLYLGTMFGTGDHGLHASMASVEIPMSVFLLLAFSMQGIDSGIWVLGTVVFIFCYEVFNRRRGNAMPPSAKPDPVISKTAVVIINNPPEILSPGGLHGRPSAVLTFVAAYLMKKGITTFIRKHNPAVHDDVDPDRMDWLYVVNALGIMSVGVLHLEAVEIRVSGACSEASLEAALSMYRGLLRSPRSLEAIRSVKTEIVNRFSIEHLPWVKFQIDHLKLFSFWYSIKRASHQKITQRLIVFVMMGIIFFIVFYFVFTVVIPLLGNLFSATTGQDGRWMWCLICMAAVGQRGKKKFSEFEVRVIRHDVGALLQGLRMHITLIVADLTKGNGSRRKMGKIKASLLRWSGAVFQKKHLSFAPSSVLRKMEIMAVILSNVKKTLHRIKNMEGVAAALSVTHVILDYLAISMGKPEPVGTHDVEVLIRRAIQLTRKENTELTRDGLASVCFDIRQNAFLRAMMNLLNNAFDARDVKSRLPVTIDVRRDGDSVIIKITDDGRGMEPKQMRWLNDAARTEAGRFSTKPNDGHGLGTLEIRQFVRDSGGSLVYSANTPRGTRATMTLPLFNDTAFDDTALLAALSSVGIASDKIFDGTKSGYSRRILRSVFRNSKREWAKCLAYLRVQHERNGVNEIYFDPRLSLETFLAFIADLPDDQFAHGNLFFWGRKIIENKKIDTWLEGMDPATVRSNVSRVEISVGLIINGGGFRAGDHDNVTIDFVSRSEGNYRDDFNAVGISNIYGGEVWWENLYHHAPHTWTLLLNYLYSLHQTRGVTGAYLQADRAHRLYFEFPRALREGFGEQGKSSRGILAVDFPNPLTVNFVDRFPTVRAVHDRAVASIIDEPSATSVKSRVGMLKAGLLVMTGVLIVLGMAVGTGPHELHASVASMGIPAAAVAWVVILWGKLINVNRNPYLLRKRDRLEPVFRGLQKLGWELTLHRKTATEIIVNPFWADLKTQMETNSDRTLEYQQILDEWVGQLNFSNPKDTAQASINLAVMGLAISGFDDLWAARVNFDAVAKLLSGAMNYKRTDPDENVNIQRDRVPSAAGDLIDKFQSASLTGQPYDDLYARVRPALRLRVRVDRRSLGNMNPIDTAIQDAINRLIQQHPTKTLSRNQIAEDSRYEGGALVSPITVRRRLASPEFGAFLNERGVVLVNIKPAAARKERVMVKYPVITREGVISMEQLNMFGGRIAKSQHIEGNRQAREELEAFLANENLNEVIVEDLITRLLGCFSLSLEIENDEINRKRARINLGTLTILRNILLIQSDVVAAVLTPDRRAAIAASIQPLTAYGNADLQIYGGVRKAADVVLRDILDPKPGSGSSAHVSMGKNLMLGLAKGNGSVDDPTPPSPADGQNKNPRKPRVTHWQDFTPRFAHPISTVASENLKGREQRLLNAAQRLVKERESNDSFGKIITVNELAAAATLSSANNVWNLLSENPAALETPVRRALVYDEIAKWLISLANEMFRDRSEGHRLAADFVNHCESVEGIDYIGPERRKEKLAAMARLLLPYLQPVTSYPIPDTNENRTRARINLAVVAVFCAFDEDNRTTEMTTRIRDFKDKGAGYKSLIYGALRNIVRTYLNERRIVLVPTSSGQSSPHPSRIYSSKETIHITLDRLLAARSAEKPAPVPIDQISEECRFKKPVTLLQNIGTDADLRQKIEQLTQTPFDHLLEGGELAVLGTRLLLKTTVEQKAAALNSFSPVNPEGIISPVEMVARLSRHLRDTPPSDYRSRIVLAVMGLLMSQQWRSAVTVETLQLVFRAALDANTSSMGRVGAAVGRMALTFFGSMSSVLTANAADPTMDAIIRWMGTSTKRSSAPVAKPRAAKGLEFLSIASQMAPVVFNPIEFDSYFEALINAQGHADQLTVVEKSLAYLLPIASHPRTLNQLLARINPEDGMGEGHEAVEAAISAVMMIFNHYVQANLSDLDPASVRRVTHAVVRISSVEPKLSPASLVSVHPLITEYFQLLPDFPGHLGEVRAAMRLHLAIDMDKGAVVARIMGNQQDWFIKMARHFITEKKIDENKLARYTAAAQWGGEMAAGLWDPRSESSFRYLFAPKIVSDAMALVHNHPEFTKEQCVEQLETDWSHLADREDGKIPFSPVMRNGNGATQARSNLAIVQDALFTPRGLGYEPVKLDVDMKRLIDPDTGEMDLTVFNYLDDLIRLGDPVNDGNNVKPASRAQEFLQGFQNWVRANVTVLLCVAGLSVLFLGAGTWVFWHPAMFDVASLWHNIQMFYDHNQTGSMAGMGLATVMTRGGLIKKKGPAGDHRANGNARDLTVRMGGGLETLKRMFNVITQFIQGRGNEPRVLLNDEIADEVDVHVSQISRALTPDDPARFSHPDTRRLAQEKERWKARIKKILPKARKYPGEWGELLEMGQQLALAGTGNYEAVPMPRKNSRALAEMAVRWLSFDFDASERAARQGYVNLAAIEIMIRLPRKYKTREMLDKMGGYEEGPHENSPFDVCPTFILRFISECRNTGADKAIDGFDAWVRTMVFKFNIHHRPNTDLNVPLPSNFYLMDAIAELEAERSLGTREYISEGEVLERTNKIIRQANKGKKVKEKRLTPKNITLRVAHFGDVRDVYRRAIALQGPGVIVSRGMSNLVQIREEAARYWQDICAYFSSDDEALKFLLRQLNFTLPKKRGLLPSQVAANVGVLAILGIMVQAKNRKGTFLVPFVPAILDRLTGVAAFCAAADNPLVSRITSLAGDYLESILAYESDLDDATRKKVENLLGELEAIGQRKSTVESPVTSVSEQFRAFIFENGPMPHVVLSRRCSRGLICLFVLNQGGSRKRFLIAGPSILERVYLQASRGRNGDKLIKMYESSSKKLIKSYRIIHGEKKWEVVYQNKKYYPAQARSAVAKFNHERAAKVTKRISDALGKLMAAHQSHPEKLTPDMIRRSAKVSWKILAERLESGEVFPLGMSLAAALWPYLHGNRRFKNLPHLTVNAALRSWLAWPLSPNPVTISDLSVQIGKMVGKPDGVTEQSIYSWMYKQPEALVAQLKDKLVHKIKVRVSPAFKEKLPVVEAPIKPVVVIPRPAVIQPEKQIPVPPKNDLVGRIVWEVNKMRNLLPASIRKMTEDQTRGLAEIMAPRMVQVYGKSESSSRVGDVLREIDGRNILSDALMPSGHFPKREFGLPTLVVFGALMFLLGNQFHASAEMKFPDENISTPVAAQLATWGPRGTENLGASLSRQRSPEEAPDANVQNAPYLLIAPDASADKAGFKKTLADAQRILHKGFTRATVQINRDDMFLVPAELKQHVFVRSNHLSDDVFSQSDLFLAYGGALAQRTSSVLVLPSGLFERMTQVDISGWEDVRVVQLNSIVAGVPQIKSLSDIIAGLEASRKHA